MAILSFSEALKELLGAISEPQKVETVPLSEAANRICAVDVYSPIDAPPFDNSAMDGYAIRAADLENTRHLTLVGKAFAGEPFTGTLQAGECVRIMTGAKIPDGADTVIMQEETIEGKDFVIFANEPKFGANIRKVGEDVAFGTKVVNQGDKLNTATLPLLASLGIAEITVYKKLTVAILSTGNELVSVGEPLADGKIYDTNRFTLRLLLEKLHCNVQDYGILPDDPELFEQQFKLAADNADVVITSGGVSVGEADFTKTVLEKLGKIGFWKIAMKPGKPFAFGQIGKAYFFGLPGNPVSALVTFYQLVQPALAKLAGLNETQMAKLSEKLTARTAFPLKKAAGRLDFQRGYFYQSALGELKVKSVGKQGSHIFSAFNESNCFIVLEAERGNVEAGEVVTIQPFNGLLQ